MSVLETLPSPEVAHPPRPGAAAPPPTAACCIMRLRTGADADTLGEQLSGLWRQLPGRRRSAPEMALSVVQTCGRSTADRERDALRLLDAEARAACPAGPRPTVRATLVNIAPGEHLLLLNVPPDTATERLLATLVGELSRLYPAASLRAA